MQDMASVCKIPEVFFFMHTITISYSFHFSCAVVIQNNVLLKKELGGLAPNYHVDPSLDPIQTLSQM